METPKCRLCRYRHNRHTFASLHLARGSNLKWIQQNGGWSSAKMLLDVYGHYMPTETGGYADALTAPGGPYTAPARERSPQPARRAPPSRRNRMGSVEPTNGLEPLTCSLRAARAVFPPRSTGVQNRMRGKGLRGGRIPRKSADGRPYLPPLLQRCCQNAVGHGAAGAVRWR